MRQATKPLAVVVTLLVATFAAACGGKGEASGGSKGSDRISVYFLLPSLQDEARINAKKGAEEEAAKLGNVDLTVDAGSAAMNGAPDELVNKLETALVKRPDAILVNPGAAQDQLRPVLQRAIGDGIKVVTVDGDIDLKGKTSYVTLDEAYSNEQAGKWLTAQLPKGGDIGIISCVINHPVTIARTKGFKAGLGSNVHVAGEVDGECDPDKSRTMTENMLQRNPNLAAIWGPTDISALGALAAVKAAGKSLPVIGHDGYKDALASIRDGGMAATVYAPAKTYGADALRLAVEAVQGKTVQSEVLVKGELVTKENVSQYLAGESNK